MKELGIAVDDGEFDDEVRCLASPVFDFRGQIVAAIGVTAPKFRLNRTRMIDAAASIRVIAYKCSVKLGANMAKTQLLRVSKKSFKNQLGSQLPKV